MYFWLIYVAIVAANVLMSMDVVTEAWSRNMDLKSCLMNLGMAIHGALKSVLALFKEFG